MRRGVDYVQVPTSLLAQVDSSVGGKTAINSSHGKNLIGAFHQPILVLADTAVLDTLPPREFRAGYAEVAKYGLLGDAAFFSWLEENWREVFAGGSARRASDAIAVSCRAKAAIVARDERETGERQLLNLGHTFGHALEVGVRISRCCTVRRSHSAWRSLSNFRRGAGCCRRRMPSAPSAISRRSACRPGWRIFIKSPTRPRSFLNSTD